MPRLPEICEPNEKTVAQERLERYLGADRAERRKGSEMKRIAARLAKPSVSELQALSRVIAVVIALPRAMHGDFWGMVIVCVMVSAVFDIANMSLGRWAKCK